jgi:hypothetical protein
MNHLQTEWKFDFALLRLFPKVARRLIRRHQLGEQSE